MTCRDALLALPGPSTTSLLLNIPHIYRTRGQPVILIDIHDYEKIRGQAIVENRPKYHYLTLAFEQLARNGVVQFIDYSEFYPRRLRKRNLDRNDDLLDQLSEDVTRRYAAVACAQWREYARGEYQEAFRDGLGEDIDSFIDMRRSERTQEQKIAHGTGDSRGWMSKVLNKDVAALHIRRNVDRAFDHYNVRGIVAGAEHLSTSSLVGATPEALDQYELPTPGALPTHLDRLDAGSRIVGLDPTELTETREALSLASDLASELVGTDDDDWFVLGPSMAFPDFNDLFDMGTISAEFATRPLNDLKTQAAEAVEYLRQEQEVASNKLQYLGEYAHERSSSDTTTHSGSNGFSVSALTSAIDQSTQLALSSQEIRSLIKERGFDQAAVFVALTCLIDPAYRYDTEPVYRQASQLKRRLDPPSVARPSLESYQKERQGETWGENRDWHEDPQADR